ncbi:MAG: hypothetical protein CO013_06515, partial [Syntrophobacterales bacterium CG_4_8_14_3_um_filter_58_8]
MSMQAKSGKMRPNHQEMIEILEARRDLFWDKGSLDPDRDRYVIAERILEFGTEENADAITRFYGDEFIRKVIRESANLSPKTVNYFAMMFDIPREESRCFSAERIRGFSGGHATAAHENGRRTMKVSSVSEMRAMDRQAIEGLGIPEA